LKGHWTKIKAKWPQARSNQIIDTLFDRHYSSLSVRVTGPGKFCGSAVCNCRTNVFCEIKQSQSPKLKLL
jgi:hypothetical protein